MSNSEERLRKLVEEIRVNNDKKGWYEFHKNFPSYEECCEYPEVKVNITTLEDMYLFLKLPCVQDCDNQGNATGTRIRVDVGRKRRVRAFFTMRERKYICRVRHYDSWSRSVARCEGRQVELLGLYSQRNHDWFYEIHSYACKEALNICNMEIRANFKQAYQEEKDILAEGLEINPSRSSREDLARLNQHIEEMRVLDKLYRETFTHMRTCQSQIYPCDRMSSWFNDMDSSLILVVSDPADSQDRSTLCVMPEFFEELYKDCYVQIPQWWRCDYSNDRVVGHRWEAPIINGSRYKPEHVQENYGLCEITNTLHHNRDLIYHEGRRCSRSGLLSIGVKFCTSCGALIEKHSMYISKCISCGDKAIAHAMGHEVNSYHNFNTWIMRTIGKEDPHKTLLMGVELEVDGYGRPDYDDCHSIRRNYRILGDIQHDGSLSEGCEFITHPSSHRFHDKHLPQFSQDMLEKYHDPDNEDNDCGVHIHINRSYVGMGNDNSTLRKMDWFCHRYKPFVCRIAGRRSANWARFSKDYSKDSWDYFGWDSIDSRYQALNFQNEHTVEFRIFATPNYDGIHMMKYVDFVDSLVHWSMQATKEEVMNTTAWDYYKAFVDNRAKKYKQLYKVLNNDSYFRKNICI
tara:strand:+ start:1449 stop:3338 length:1890 start_codon:yes stop_codon:yes gene_type:complete